MIAIRRPSPPASRWQDVFLTMLPLIRRQAWRACRQMAYGRRQEFVAEVVAHVAVALAELARQGKLDIAYATPLTNYALKRVRSGRRVGARLNVHDVISVHCRLKKGVRIIHLDDLPDRLPLWKTSLLEDRRAGPAETAAARIDLADWLDTLPTPKRQIAESLAVGESTNATARQAGLTAGRVSQLRRELEANWRSFQGEEPQGQSRSAGR